MSRREFFRKGLLMGRQKLTTFMTGESITLTKGVAIMATVTKKVTSNGKQKGRKERQTSRPLPTDRISFDKQLGILRAFAIVSGDDRKAVTLVDVSVISDMAATTLSQSSAFLVDAGFLSRTKDGLIPQPEVLSYARAFRFHRATAARKLQPIIRKAWFAECLLPRLQFRNMPIEEALVEMADDVGASADSKDKLKLLLQFMEACGLLKRSNGVLHAGEQGEPTEAAQADSNTPAPESQDDVTTVRTDAEPTIRNTQQGGSAGGVEFAINVNVDMAELSNWSADRITAFFNGLGQVIAAKKGLDQKE